MFFSILRSEGGETVELFHNADGSMKSVQSLAATLCACKGYAKNAIAVSRVVGNVRAFNPIS
jgi:hypothetical protein